MFTEVILEVAAPFEHFVATVHFASEINLLSFSALAANFDALVPGPGNIAEGLGKEVKDLARALAWV